MGLPVPGHQREFGLMKTSEIITQQIERIADLLAERNELEAQRTAAPQLLEACERAYKWIDAGCAEETKEATQKRLRAAISKAFEKGAKVV